MMNLDDFGDYINSYSSSSTLEHIDIFRSFAINLDVNKIIADELRVWLTEPRRPPPIVSNNIIRIKKYNDFVLDLNILEEKKVKTRKIISSHQDIIQFFYNDGEYEIFNICKNREIEMCIERMEVGKFSKGDVFGTDGTKNIFLINSHKPVKFLTLSEFESNGVKYKFDYETFKLIGTFAASPVSTIIQLSARFLGYYGDSSCLPSLHYLMNDPIYAIQWESACAIMRIDEDEGIRAMKYLTKANDIDVAQAAKKILDQIN